MKTILFWVIIFLNYSTVKSQELTKYLELRDILFLVKTNHPIAIQAGIITEQADANLLKTRGEFDPKISYENNNKFFQGKNYYDLGSLGLTIPTWPGADISLGTNTANGVYVNPEEITPPGGLSGIGASIPLLRNLITDQRRTLLKQAKLLRGQNQAVRNIFLNGLCADVIQAYTEWSMAWKEMEMYDSSLKLTNTRIIAIREEVLAGSKAAVDTLETYVQKLNFSISLQEAQLKLVKTRLALSIHLWNQDGKPLEPDETVKPKETSFALLDSMAMQYADSTNNQTWLNSHPMLISNNFDIQSAALDVKLKKQNLLPDLNLKYRLLAPGSFVSDPSFNTDNYQFGVKLGTSLYLRKERGEYQLSKLKKENFEWKLIQKNREILNKSIALLKQRNTYKSILNEFNSVVVGYELLYQTELSRLEAGESNMFMVNSRELKLAENRLKFIQITRKSIESNIEYLENAGVLWSLIQ